MQGLRLQRYGLLEEQMGMRNPRSV
ncbi:hypothetical protein KM92DES2_10606 [uncultured Desulfovibrio sp.]|uniref:Uncharacterized protein n=1 Tax=uncultured Desulfovibrio sp. TaxID=167968 RepID=A0A212J6G5_9BACT|nr:hypothetical protein KM92DES2_10606 [uncultured Desulfovibrio sp.]